MSIMTTKGPFGNAVSTSCLILTVFSTTSISATRDVFFIHYYDAVTPSRREVCAVESAARQVDADVTVRVYASRPDDVRAHVAHLPPDVRRRVDVTPLDVDAVTQGTSLEGFLLSDEYKQKSVKKTVVQNVCDGARLALLYKHGGLYMDLDVIVTNGTRLMDRLNRPETSFLAPEHGTQYFNSAFLKFTPHHRFLQLALDRFRWQYDGKVWGQQGPRLVTTLYNQTCGRGERSESRQPRKWCGTITALRRNDVYPVHYSNAGRFLDPLDKQMKQWRQIERSSVAVHYWNMMLVGTPPRPWCVPPGSLLDHMFRTYCPSTRQHYAKNIVCDD